MDTERKKYLFVVKSRVMRLKGDGYAKVRRHYEKDLTEDELDDEIKKIQGERPISYAYMEISGDILYQGLIRTGIVPVTGGKMWYAWDDENYVPHYFNTKKECGDFIKANFKGEYRKACLMLLAHDTGRAKVNL